MSQSMNGIDIITDGVAVLENGDLTCNNITSTKIQGSTGSYFSGLTSNIQYQFSNLALYGSTGPTGATGPTGNSGTSTNTGSTGSTGNTGNTGNTGPTGNIGPAGTNGTNGSNGSNGADGTDGASIAQLLVSLIGLGGTIASSLITALGIAAIEAEVAFLTTQLGITNTVNTIQDTEINNILGDVYFISSDTSYLGLPLGNDTFINSSLTVLSNFEVDGTANQIRCNTPTLLKVNGNSILETTNNLLTITSPAIFNGTVAINNETTVSGEFKHKGITSTLAYNSGTGYSCSTGVNFKNNVNNKIYQNFKVNPNNTNLFNAYDTQIIATGNDQTTTQTNNTGGMWINSLATGLCCDNDSSSTKYILFSVNGTTNLSNVYYKSNTSTSAYIADATVSIAGSSGTVGNKGLYTINSGTHTINADTTTINSSYFNLNGILTQTAQECYNSLCGTNPYNTYVGTYNKNLTTTSNYVGTYYKADPTKNTVYSDASIIVKPNDLADSFTVPALNYGTMSINAHVINLGDASTTVNILGDLVLQNQAIHNNRLVPRNRN